VAQHLDIFLLDPPPTSAKTTSANVFSVVPSPALDLLEPGPSGSPGAPGSVSRGDSGPWPEGHGSVGRR